MAVDLSAGVAGVMAFNGGQRFYCMWVERVDDTAYRVRIESGWHERYTRDGKRIGDSGSGVRDQIVEFTPMPWDDPRCVGLATEITP